MKRIEETKMVYVFTDAPEFRGCLTIQNHGKKKTEQRVISKNKHPILQNI